MHTYLLSVKHDWIESIRSVECLLLTITLKQQPSNLLFLISSTMNGSKRILSMLSSRQYVSYIFFTSSCSISFSASESSGRRILSLNSSEIWREKSLSLEAFLMTWNKLLGEATKYSQYYWEIANPGWVCNWPCSLSGNDAIPFFHVSLNNSWQS